MDLKPASLAQAAVAEPTVNTGRSKHERGQAGTALRLVSTVATTRSGIRKLLETGTIDKSGATTGHSPSAATRAAVWLAPGSGRVINTRFTRLTLVKQSRGVLITTFSRLGHQAAL